MFFFNFYISRARPEKLCDFNGCNFKSRASQEGLNTNRQIDRRGSLNFDWIIDLSCCFVLKLCGAQNVICFICQRTNELTVVEPTVSP